MPSGVRLGTLPLATLEACDPGRRIDVPPSHVPCQSRRPGSRRLHAGHRLASNRDVRQAHHERTARPLAFDATSILLTTLQQRTPAPNISGRALSGTSSWSPPDAIKRAFSLSLTTTVFSQRSTGRFGALPRRTTPEGQQASISSTAPPMKITYLHRSSFSVRDTRLSHKSRASGSGETAMIHEVSITFAPHSRRASQVAAYVPMLIPEDRLAEVHAVLARTPEASRPQPVGPDSPDAPDEEPTLEAFWSDQANVAEHLAERSELARAMLRYLAEHAGRGSGSLRSRLAWGACPPTGSPVPSARSAVTSAAGTSTSRTGGTRTIPTVASGWRWPPRSPMRSWRRCRPPEKEDPCRSAPPCQPARFLVPRSRECARGPQTSNGLPQGAALPSRP